MARENDFPDIRKMLFPVHGRHGGLMPCHTFDGTIRFRSKGLLPSNLQQTPDRPDCRKNGTTPMQTVPLPLRRMKGICLMKQSGSRTCAFRVSISTGMRGCITICLVIVLRISGASSRLIRLDWQERLIFLPARRIPYRGLIRGDGVAAMVMKTNQGLSLILEPDSMEIYPGACSISVRGCKKRTRTVCGVANPRRVFNPAAVCALHPIPIRSFAPRAQMSGRLRLVDFKRYATNSIATNPLNESAACY